MTKPKKEKTWEETIEEDTLWVIQSVAKLERDRILSKVEEMIEGMQKPEQWELQSWEEAKQDIITKIKKI